MPSALKNFAPVADHLATAGQPPADAFLLLRAAGFQRIINLGLDNQAYSLADEKAAVQSAGMAYHPIPVPFEAPQPAHFAEFLSLMDFAPGEKVLLHCASNYRASAFAALYGVRRLGWDRSRAETFLTAVWQPNPVWRAFLDGLYAFARPATHLEGRVFRTLSNTPNGEVAGETRFRYHEEGGRVWADYAGGAVRQGRLSGWRLSETRIEFTYRHLNLAGEERTGECVSAIRFGEDGRMRIRESWRWTCGDRSAGESEIEECPG